MKMRNAEGEGPATEMTVKTLEEPPSQPEDKELKFILVSDNTILLQGQSYFYDFPNFIYNSSERILGVGIHVAEKVLFIADETQTIYK